MMAATKATGQHFLLRYIAQTWGRRRFCEGICRCDSAMSNDEVKSMHGRQTCRQYENLNIFGEKGRVIEIRKRWLGHRGSAKYGAVYWRVRGGGWCSGAHVLAKAARWRRRRLLVKRCRSAAGGRAIEKRQARGHRSSACKPSASPTSGWRRAIARARR